ncbi:aspartate kinase [Candidatus Kaiserbacteria bacterium]|nr:aspartate kinase [Candidatus Kaiserbacteria bacterium]
MARDVKVLKFGGTSLGSPEAVERVVSIIQQAAAFAKSSGVPRAVVVSAMGDVTDTLIKIANVASREDQSYKKLLARLERSHIKTVRKLVSARNQQSAEEVIHRMFRYLNEAVTGVALVRDLSPQAIDYVMSYGERLSAHLLTEVLNDRGIVCEYLNARKIITTDDHFGAASVDFKTTNANIRKYFRVRRKIQIVTGYIGATRDGKTTTLGRGGSDYSAAILGAALHAKVLEIWTDVSGLFSADPRLVRGAKVVHELAFEEAGELAYFGAKVLHPKMILPAMREKIPVRILNTFRPSDKGTTIVSGFAQRRSKSRTVEALTFKRPVIAIHVHSPEFFDSNGLMTRIFEVFDKHRTSIDLVATSVAGVSLTIDNDKYLSNIIAGLSKYGEVRVERGKAIVCAVGGSVKAAGVAGRMFTVLGKRSIPVELISQAASGVSITFVVRERDAKKALKVLHKEYIE